MRVLVEEGKAEMAMVETTAEDWEGKEVGKGCRQHPRRHPMVVLLVGLSGERVCARMREREIGTGSTRE